MSDASSDPAAPGLVAGLKARWQQLQDDHDWLAHVLRANARVGEVRGNYFAAGVTFFSFVSLFPLMLVVVSVLGFVLARDQSLKVTLLRDITEHAPSSLQQTLTDLLDTAQKNATGLGIAGLVSGLLTGLGWISNLREACRAMWKLPKAPLNFVREKLADLIALGTMFGGIVVTFAVTGIGTAASGFLLDRSGLDTVPGAKVLTAAVGIVVAILASLLLFGWFLTRLPRVDVARGVLVRGTFLAAIGFEILTILGSYYIKRVNQSPAAGVFGSILGTLVFVNLVARYLLFATAWVATGVEGPPARAATAAAVEPDPAVEAPRPLSAAGVAGVLVGAGAAIGGATVALARRRT